MKLTKTQKEFFQDFVKESIVGILAQVCPEDMKATIPPVSRLILANSIEEGKLDDFIEKAAKEILSNVEFKTIRKVDRFTKSADFQKVMEAVNTVVYDTMKEEFMNLAAATGQVSETFIKTHNESEAADNSISEEAVEEENQTIQ